MSNTKKLTMSAVCLALGLLLPFVTGQVPQVGNMLCPMHLPVFLCAFLCGPVWGAGVGVLTPLLRSFLFHAPPIPLALAMAPELLTYGLTAGLLYVKGPRSVGRVYLALGTAMVTGRLVWGAARYLLAGLGGSEFSFAMFLSGALLTAWPGILLQLIAVPSLVRAMEKTKLAAT